MHHAAYHFIRELGISSTRKRNNKSKTLANNEEDNIILTELDDNNVEGSDADNDADINTSMDIEASAEDAEAMRVTIVVDFDPGDTLGKLLAFINQVHMLSEGVQDLLAQICEMHSIKPIKLRLWVRTRWGSLSDCLKFALAVQKVRYYLL